MDLEWAEAEIRLLPGVYACGAAADGVAVFVDPVHDGAAVQAAVAGVLGALGIALPVRMLGGAPPLPPALPVRTAARVPAAAAAVAAAAILVAGAASALATLTGGGPSHRRPPVGPPISVVAPPPPSPGSTLAPVQPRPQLAAPVIPPGTAVTPPPALAVIPPPALVAAPAAVPPVQVVRVVRPISVTVPALPGTPPPVIPPPGTTPPPSSSSPPPTTINVVVPPSPAAPTPPSTVVIAAVVPPTSCPPSRDEDRGRKKDDDGREDPDHRGDGDGHGRVKPDRCSKPRSPAPHADGGQD